MKQTTLLRLPHKAMLSVLCLPLLSVAQTNDCNDNAGGQLSVGTSCNPVTFNSSNNTDYWDDAWWYGVCNEDDYDDAWMWFDATSTSTTITYTPSNGDPILTIFEGGCSPGMSNIVACSDNIGTVSETTTFATTPGQRYRIRIQNWGSNATMNGTVCAFSAGGGATTASDCAVATNVCTDLSFQIDPNGYGAINEIPASGSYGNPSTNPASANYGCLLVGEYNSTWMVVNISSSGNLEFVFGGLGAQAGYYDWIMYPYTGAATCTAIASNTVAPVRCNWNAVSSGGTGISDVIPGGGNAGNFEPPLAVTAGQQYIICFSNYSNAVTTVPLQFLTDAGNAGVSCTPLGFTMDGMTIQCLDGSRRIEWQVPALSEVTKYAVEKSRDHVSWETVETVYNGELQGSKIHFTVDDYTGGAGLEYYRIKQYLPDGAMVLSSTLTADCSGGDDPFRVYPNPNDGIMQLTYESATDAILEFVDIYGKTVYSQRLDRTVNTKTVQVRAVGVPAGMYLYRIVMDSKTKTGSVIIR